MPARILSIGTALPATRLPQEHVRDLFAAQPGVDRLTRRLIHAAFDAAAIDSRRTVLAALASGGADDERMPVRDAAGRVVAVFNVDSFRAGVFDGADREGLEALLGGLLSD